jgi:diaminopimelate epimerase
MHGLGNDFVVIDRVTKDFELKPERIAQLGDRKTGIGFDQLLIVDPPDHSDCDFRYRIYNSDGSSAEQCGNGARCFARFALDNQLTIKKHLRLQTNTGPITASVLDNSLVEIDMGIPCYFGDDLPFPSANSSQPELQSITLPARSSGAPEQQIEFMPVSMGNPHAVIEVSDVAHAPVLELGAAVGAHHAFPAGVNVGFCQYVDENFARLRVFERGAGETRACGSGACAAVVAGVLRGKLSSKVKVSLPGGKLRIMWTGHGATVQMIGPTATVYRGEFKI